MSRWREEKKNVLEAAREILHQGLVVGKSGNVSLRLPPEGGRDLLAITPSQREYESLDIDDIQVVDFQAEPVEGDLTPSVETMLHIGIYQARQNINAVIHTHSVFASMVGVAGLEIPPILEDQVNLIGGEIRLAGYAMSGSDELVANVVTALGPRNAVLLPNHGAVGTGRTMKEAFTVCQVLEKTARIYLGALALGKVNPLPAEALEKLKALFDAQQQPRLEGGL